MATGITLSLLKDNHPPLYGCIYSIHSRENVTLTIKYLYCFESDARMITRTRMGSARSALLGFIDYLPLAHSLVYYTVDSAVIRETRRRHGEVSFGLHTLCTGPL